MFRLSRNLFVVRPVTILGSAVVTSVMAAGFLAAVLTTAATVNVGDSPVGDSRVVVASGGHGWIGGLEP